MQQENIASFRITNLNQDFVKPYSDTKNDTKGKRQDDSAARCYLEYRKTAHENLININNNLSLMLQENFAGIDSICQKVRMCLLNSGLSNEYCKLPKSETIGNNAYNNKTEEQTSLDVSITEEDINYKEKNENKIDNQRNIRKKINNHKGNKNHTKERTTKQVKPFITILKARPRETTFSQNYVSKTFDPIKEIKNYDKTVKNVNEETNQHHPHFIDTKEHAKNNQGRMKPNNGQLPEESSTDQDTQRSYYLFDRFNRSPAMDVYRKKAVTNLHGRLIAQVEANDSLIFFQKLMGHKKNKLYKYRPASANGALESIPIRTKTATNQVKRGPLSKYENSLWFKQKSCPKVKKQKIGPLQKSSSEKTLNEMVKTRASSTPLNHYNMEANKCQLYSMVPKTPKPYKRLKHFDILDDITENDLVPLKAEYPRKDVIKVDIKESYLYQLVYGKDKENAWSQLLRADSKASCCNRIDFTDSNIGQDSGDKNTTNDMRYDVLKKLSQYIYPVEKTKEDTLKNVYTIMPVHVFYDNVVPNYSGKTNHHLMSPMKECNELQKKRAEWSETGKRNKPMRIVYDPVIKRIEKEIKVVSARPENNFRKQKNMQVKSCSPKNFAQYCTPIQQTSTKTSQKIQKPKGAPQILTRSPLKSRESELPENLSHLSLNFKRSLPKHTTPKTVKPTFRQQVLDQLRKLKQKNDNIQINIQKAVEVIENKMIDILSKPKTTSSVAAFDEMKKEITHVLNLMKTPVSQEPKTSRNGGAPSTENETDISDQLIKKLENILSATVDTCSVTNLASGKRARPRKKTTSKTPKETKSLQAVISTTEDKLIVHGFDPKKPVKIKNSVCNPPKFIECQSLSPLIGDRDLIPTGDQVKDYAKIDDKDQTKLLSQGDCQPIILTEDRQGVENDVKDDKENTGGYYRDDMEDTNSGSLISSQQQQLSASLSSSETDKSSSCSQKLKEIQQFPEEDKKEESFYDEVNKIISRVENVYSQLEEFEKEVKAEDLLVLNATKIPIFKDEKEEIGVKSEIFLTPFMHALKDLRNCADKNESPTTSRSPSYYNIINFLDNLSGLKEDQPTEVRTAR